MFEEYSFENIIDQMLERVKDMTGYEVLEGSILYNALAPAAWELAEAYLALETVYETTFADTAPREELIRRAAERGVSPPYKATKAILKGVFNVAVPIGSRFSLGDLTYCVIQQLEDDTTYKLECETEGTAGNKQLGILYPLEFIEGLEQSKLTELLIPAEDEEETEAYRARYFESIDIQTFGGNQADYLKKVRELSGVSDAKVYPVWKGGGTVKVVIMDSQYQAPSNELIKTVQQIIDPDQEGVGVGLAPIGHKVTIEGVKGKRITIGCHVIFQIGYDFERIKEKIEAAIKEYFLNLSKEWSKTEGIIIRIARIEMAILNVNGIIDVVETRLNDGTENLILHSNEIPELGEVHELPT